MTDELKYTGIGLAAALALAYTAKKVYDKDGEFKKAVDAGYKKGRSFVQDKDKINKAGEWIRNIARHLHRKVEEEVKLIEHREITVDDDSQVEIIE